MRRMMLDVLKNESSAEVVALETLRNEVEAELAEALLQCANAMEGAPVLGIGGVTE